MKAKLQVIAGCLSLLSVLLFALGSAYAQEARGTIFGRVADPSGAAISQAKITVRNLATGIVQSYRTTSTGDYSAVNLNPGTYEVSVDMTGFKNATASGLIVQVDQTLRQDFTLQVGASAQTVTVHADSQMIQAGNATVGEVITEQQIAALPLTGRNFTNLITLAAGVSTADGGIQNSVFAPQGLNTQFQSTSVNGARPASISYIVDSFTDTDFFFSKPTNVPSADAIQEFKLQNGLYSSQYGFGSAQVNVAVKSGTNQLHGTAYDFVQNSFFQPLSPIVAYQAEMAGKPKPTKAPHHVQNEFGGSLGGPFFIPKLYNGKDRSFWFFDYDGGRNRTTSGLALLQVPTAKERQGDFSDWPYPIYDPSTTGDLPPTATDPSGRMPFSGNQISTIDPIAKALLAYYPQPNTTCQMPCSNLSGFLPIKVDTDVYTGRFDQHIGERNQLWVTVNDGDITQPTPSFFPASSTEVTSGSKLIGGHYLRPFSNNLVGDFRVGYSSLDYHNGASSSFGPNLSQQLGFNNTVNIPAYYGIPVITLGSQYSQAGTSNNGYTETDHIYEYGTNITYIHGPHTLNIGVDWRTIAIRDQDGFTVNGGLRFSGSYTASDPVAGARGVPGPTSGNGFADLLLGDPLSATPPAPLGSDDFDLRSNQYAFYAQDDYHVLPRLTLNLGLRYEQPAHFHSTNDSGSILNLNTPGGGVIYASQSFVNTVDAPDNIKSTYYQCCAPNTLTENRGIKFLPRIGFALSLSQSNRAVLRGGYGIFSDIYMRFYDGTDYDNNNLQLLTANPNYPAASGAESTSPLALNTLWLPPVPLNPAASFPLPWQYGIASAWPLNKFPYTQQWGLDVQYALTPNTLIDVGYVGSRSLHQPTQFFYNQAALPSTSDTLADGTVCNKFTDASQAPAECAATGSAFQPVDTRVPFSNIAVGSYADGTILSSNYNSMQVRLNRRMSQGLTFLASYTYSKALDETSEIAVFNNGSGGSNIITNAQKAGFDYGPADYDQTHRLVASYLYELPVGKGKRFSLGPANWVFGDWQTSGVVTLASGYPFSVFCCARGAANDLTGNPFSDRLRANVGPSSGSFHKSLYHLYDTTRYSVPALGTFGNQSRNTLRAPMIRQANVSFLKEFPVNEHGNRFEYRLDIFNFLSSWHTGTRVPVHVYSTVPSASFGSIIPLTAPYNAMGERYLWTPRTVQMALRYTF